MVMADEIELKLELSPAGAEQLLAADMLAKAPKVAKQLSTYFDTDDRALAEAGFSLRIRRTGRTRIQTIKANGASTAGLFMRTEWERPVDGDTPLLDHTSPLLTVLGNAANDAAPIFEVRIERRKWVLDEEGTSIEVVLDRGEVVIGDQREAVCEIELELKIGNPADLFGLARRIAEVAPVRLGVLAKSDRGYALTEAPRNCFRAAPIALSADIDAAGAFKRIVQACIRQYRLNEDGLVARRDPLALHQARVAIRRMRSAFSIFKPMIGDDGAALRDELRWLASQLGDVRDLDVLVDAAPAGLLRDQIGAARAAAYDDLLATLDTKRARTIMIDVADWLAQGRWTGGEDRKVDGNQPARAFAASALARLRRRIKRQGESLAGVSDEMRHEVRKDAKKLRYASEFFASLFGRKREQRRYRHFVDALETLQDRLGALNDLAVSPAVLTRLGLNDDPEAAALLNGSSKRKMLERAEDAYEQLFDTKRFW